MHPSFESESLATRREHERMAHNAPRLARLGSLRASRPSIGGRLLRLCRIGARPHP